MKFTRSVFIKRFLAALMAALLVCGCAGCGQKKTFAGTKEELEGLLADISDGSNGTFGDIQLAVDLFSWMKATSMSPSEVASAVKPWLEEQKPEIQEAFTQQLVKLRDTGEKLLNGTASELLKKAGIDAENLSFGETVREIFNAILESGGAEKID